MRGLMKKIKSTLQVFNQSGIPEVPGVIKGIMLKKLSGSAEHPSERISVGIATFAPGTHEHLHWHLIETFHYVLAGAATVRDIEGNVYNVGAGDVVYGPPGLRGSHEWEVKESLTLLTVKATNDPERAIQFNFDMSTMASSAELDYLITRGVADMEKSFY